MTAREAALRALTACRKNGAWSDGALKQLLAGMERREAALASRLCYGVLQNRMLLDYWLSFFVRGKVQPVVQDILRLALYQIKFSDKIPPSAAVNEAVEQTKRSANVQASKLVNGVLRSILRAKRLPEPEDLATKYSHPQALVELLDAQYGEKTEAILRSHNEAPETVLQVNTLKTTAAKLAMALEEAGAEYCGHESLPNCLYVSSTGSLEALKPYRDGWFYVQDAAARLAVEAAEIQPEMRVLDCCAAPGGKSFAAAMRLENRGELISCDIHAHKLKLIENGASRLGVEILKTKLQDASTLVPEWVGAMDAVICDVPCSGLGVIRKKPDIRYKELKQTERLPELQRRILENQANYVKPNGVLIYSTCTILRRENEAVVEAFLAEHPQFISQGMKTYLPCDDNTDGFFICKLRRKP
ncbi:MAG: 16S rRNA (cytosine(967)-C(5))-methyltransferase RsmB [Ruminococcaceae bacterium]|nr:16S rRNA (cytosine(967)-C(5))-methyltransferase RsmB [Oscillospiraceae bacterium]